MASTFRGFQARSGSKLIRNDTTAFATGLNILARRYAQKTKRLYSLKAAATRAKLSGATGIEEVVAEGSETDGEP